MDAVVIAALVKHCSKSAGGELAWKHPARASLRDATIEILMHDPCSMDDAVSLEISLKAFLDSKPQLLSANVLRSLDTVMSAYVAGPTYSALRRSWHNVVSKVKQQIPSSSPPVGQSHCLIHRTPPPTASPRDSHLFDRACHSAPCRPRQLKSAASPLPASPGFSNPDAPDNPRTRRKSNSAKAKTHITKLKQKIRQQGARIKQLEASLRKAEVQELATKGHNIKLARFEFMVASARKEKKLQKQMAEGMPFHDQRLSMIGGYRLAIKKNKGHGSQLSASDQFEVGVTRQCVSLWEIKLAANLLLGSRAHYAEATEFFKAAHEQSNMEHPCTSWVMHHILGDATNCTATKGLKAHVVVVTSRISSLGAFDEGASPAATLDDLESSEHTVWPDLQSVPPSCKAAEQRALYLRQICCAGVPSWLEDDPMPVPEHDVHLRVYLLGSDAASEQKAAGLLIRGEVAAKHNVVFIHGFCVFHQLHLIVEKSLKLGKDRYWAKLATFVNVWRAAGSQFKIFSAWKQAFGEGRATVAAKTLPPRPLKGRWGAVHDTETYCLRAGKPETETVFHDVFAKKTTKRRKQQTSLEAQLDDEGDYSEKVGRWISQTLVNVRDCAFWATMTLQHIAREPIMHALASIQKTLGGHNTTAEGKDIPIVRLVGQTTPAVLTELEALLSSADCAWQEALDYVADELQQSETLSDCVHLAVSYAADWERRFGIPGRHYPRRLTMYVWSQCNVTCSIRKTICKELLLALRGKGMASEIDSEMFKIAKTFKADIEYGTQTGGCGTKRFFAFVWDLALQWPVSTQVVEGTNSVLKLMVKRSPNISMKLLSARTTIKRTFPATNIKTERISGWTVHEAAAKECASRHLAQPDALKALIEDANRWEVLDHTAMPFDASAPPAARPRSSRKNGAWTDHTQSVDRAYAAAMLCALQRLITRAGESWGPTSKYPTVKMIKHCNARTKTLYYMHILMIKNHSN